MKKNPSFYCTVCGAVLPENASKTVVVAFIGAHEHGASIWKTISWSNK